MARREHETRHFEAAGRVRLRIATGLALALHGVFVLLLGTFVTRPGQLPERGEAVLSTQDVEVALLDPSKPPTGSLERLPTPDLQPESEVQAKAPAHVDRRPAAGDRLAKVPRQLPEEISPIISSELPQKGSSSAGPRAGNLSLEQLGIGSRNPFLSSLGSVEGSSVRQESAGAAASASKKLRMSLQAGTLERDRAVGLARGGPVVAALRAATYGGALPANGSAEFMATVSTLGLVVRLEPVSASSDLAAWQEVGHHALVALARKKLRVPPGSKGLTVRLQVDSALKLPSGHDPGLGVSVLGIPVKKGEGDASSHLSILEPVVDLRVVEVPNPSGGDPLKLPTLNVGVAIAGIEGDPADVGATPQRVVHVRIVEERPL